MLTNQEIINLINTKEKSIKIQMDELLKQYKANNMNNYYSFNCVFIDSVKSLLDIIHSNTKSVLPLNQNEKDIYINSSIEKEENVLKLTEINPEIKKFITDMINNFTNKSKEIINEYNMYKNIQYVIDNYIKLLLLIKKNVK
jgi:hypothetical protein